MYKMLISFIFFFQVCIIAHYIDSSVSLSLYTYFWNIYTGHQVYKEFPVEVYSNWLIK